MSIVETPWSGMRLPTTSGISTLRVALDSIKPWYWIKSDGGCCGIAIQLASSEKELAVNIGGTAKIDIIRVDDSNDDHYLGVVIRSSELATVFYRLCTDLIQACNEAESTNQILGILKRRVAAWQRLFEKGGRMLSPEKCLGLMTEIKFLTEQWIPKISATGVKGWLGPDGSPQDFKDVGRKIAVEIKAHGFKSDVVKISSKEQLDFSGNLYLVAYPCSISSDKNCKSLNQYIDEIKRIIPSGQRQMFDERLLEAGYVYDEYYDEVRFSVSEPKAFNVGDDFPRLTVDTLPPAISGVRYDLNLSSIAEWSCLMKEIGKEG